MKDRVGLGGTYIMKMGYMRFFGVISQLLCQSLRVELNIPLCKMWRFSTVKGGTSVRDWVCILSKSVT